MSGAVSTHVEHPRAHRWQQPPRTPWLPLDMTVAGLRGSLAFAVALLTRRPWRGNGEHA